MKHLIVDFLNRWKWWILLVWVFVGADYRGMVPQERRVVLSLLFTGFIGAFLAYFEHAAGSLRVAKLMPVPRWKIGLVFWLIAVVIVPAMAALACLVVHWAARLWYGEKMSTSVLQIILSLGLSASFSGPMLLAFSTNPDPRTLPFSQLRILGRVRFLLSMVIAMLVPGFLAALCISKNNILDTPWPFVMGVGWALAFLSYPVFMRFQLYMGQPLSRRIGTEKKRSSQPVASTAIRFRPLPHPWLRFCAGNIGRMMIVAVVVIIGIPVQIGFVGLLAALADRSTDIRTILFSPLGFYSTTFACLVLCAMAWAIGSGAGYPSGLRSLRSLPLSMRSLLCGTLSTLILGLVPCAFIFLLFGYWMGAPVQSFLAIILSLPLIAGLTLLLADILLRWGAPICIGACITAGIGFLSLYDALNEGKLSILREMGSSALLPAGLILFILGASWLHRLIRNSSAAYRKRIDPFADMTMPR